MKTWRTALAALLLGAGVAPLAYAMTDPTRPPAGFADASSDPAVRTPPVLQSIILKAGMRAAIIDGERVQVGGRYRGAEVVRITETEVVLRESGRTEVLRMYPDIEKKTVNVQAPAQAKALPGRSRP